MQTTKECQKDCVNLKRLAIFHIKLFFAQYFLISKRFFVRIDCQANSSDSIVSFFFFFSSLSKKKKKKGKYFVLHGYRIAKKCQHEENTNIWMFQSICHAWTHFFAHNIPSLDLDIWFSRAKTIHHLYFCFDRNFFFFFHSSVIMSVELFNYMGRNVCRR